MLHVCMYMHNIILYARACMYVAIGKLHSYVRAWLHAMALILTVQLRRYLPIAIRRLISMSLGVVALLTYYCCLLAVIFVNYTSCNGQ